MIEIRRQQARGRSRTGWLDSRHTFSFAEYHDPDWMGFGVLRVVNDDRVAPGAGFGMHPHRDMEILSYVVEGSIEHRDSLGHRAVVRPGEIQRMSAGTGVTHSEFNPSETEALRFLQIWIVPERRGIDPGYEQKPFPLDESRGRLLLVASRDGRDGSVIVHQDVAVHAGRFAEGDRHAHRLGGGRRAWLQVVRGGVTANGVALEEGDGASVQGEETLEILATSEAEVLLFELA